MTLTLAQLTTQVQTLFGDDGTRFDADMCEAAIRQALKDFNVEVPRHEAEVFASVPQQYEYELTDTAALFIVDVLRQGDDTYAELHSQLAYIAYNEDERYFFRLAVCQSTGYIICRYTTPHTIADLDGSVESTLPAGFDPILLDGACYRAALARSASRVEEINLNASVQKLWQQIADEYHQAFNIGMILASRQNAPSIPLVEGWKV